MDRRTAITSGLIAAAMTASGRSQATPAPESGTPLDEALSRCFSKPIFIATWPFGQAACERARSVLQGAASLRDAVEQGINLTELDATVSSVGFGGWPNAAGVVQLDASFMDGRTHTAGAVAALEGFPNPISVARRVMEHTPHVMLVGEDAAKFARQQGFASRDMLTPAARQAWEQWRAKQPPDSPEKSSNSAPAPPERIPTPSENSHDTIALLGLAEDGQLVGGCSTSGLAFKLPGRVGDSPLIGSGLYVDGDVGAAGATGVGENVLRYCGSFLIVEFMRQGMTPTAACEAAIRRIASGDRRAPAKLSVNFVAINLAGQVGAAGTDADFRCAIVDNQQSLLVQPVLVT